MLAHLHASHWDTLRILGVGSQAVSVHWHLDTFCRQFQMLETKDAANLAELTNNLRRMNVCEDYTTANVDNSALTSYEGMEEDAGQQDVGQQDAGQQEPGRQEPPRLQDANAQV